MKNLKNILGAVALVLVCAFGMTSCGSKTIEDYVAEYQAKCPLEQGPATMTAVNYDGEVYETVIEVPADLFQGLVATADQQVAQSIEATKAQAKVDPFTKLLVENGISMRILYTCEGEELPIDMPAELLQ